MVAMPMAIVSMALWFYSRNSKFKFCYEYQRCLVAKDYGLSSCILMSPLLKQISFGLVGVLK